MYLMGQKLEVALHSLHREYKNVQKSVLTNVNIQRTGKTSLQMFVYFISFIIHLTQIKTSFLPNCLNLANKFFSGDLQI